MKVLNGGRGEEFVIVNVRDDGREETGEEMQSEKTEPNRRKCGKAKNGLALQLWIEAEMIPRTGAG